MKKFLTLFLVFGMFSVLYAERCACGSMASGTTIEYSVFGSGQNGSNCCTIGLAYTSENEPALSLTWRDNNNGTYTMIRYVEYENPNQAQRACCDDAA
ncbi:hypothetical protein [Flavobacterium sp. C4GT6]|uniref:hypothetical protein n=1 Tax=Flavobacterium sp. C4GT6 TaxID=3103818 RepID=UPI002ED2C1FC